MANCLSQNYWIEKSPIPGYERFATSSFVIGDSVYLVMGASWSNGVLKEVWRYDPTNDTWFRKADFPTSGRASSSFVLGNKGYIVGGSTGSGSLNEVWEYDPVIDQWTQKNNFPGGVIGAAVAFVIQDKAYITTGFNGINCNNLLWEYSATSDSWSPKANFLGGQRAWASGFSIGRHGYVSGGRQGIYYYNDWWDYDQSTDSWQQVDNCPDTLIQASAFSIANTGYVGTGYFPSGIPTKHFWAYSPSANSWVQKSNFGGTERAVATGFAINGKGYIGFGDDSTQGAFTTDLWEYTPDTTNGITNLNKEFSFSVFPNPASDIIHVSFSILGQNATIIISNLIDEELYRKDFSGSATNIPIAELPAGIYLLQIKTAEGVGVRKFVVE